MCGNGKDTETKHCERNRGGGKEQRVKVQCVNLSFLPEASSATLFPDLFITPTRDVHVPEALPM